MPNYDVAIIGGGPCGCLAALAFAKKKKRVLLLEANPQASERLAGEWLHPPAYESLKQVGVDITPEVPYESGRGFAVFPDDGTPPIVLPYESGTYGFAIEHSRLVERLRERVEAQDQIEFLPFTKASRINGQHLTYQTRTGKNVTVTADLIVGASGKASIGHDSLGIEREVVSYSRMAGLILEQANMPFEGFGHVFLGGPGPVLCYRIAHDRIRVCLDVPISIPVNRNKQAVLWEGFQSVMPPELRGAFRRALEKGPIFWAANQIRPRVEFGRDGLALIGDAVGHHHPLTAVGMTLGFKDALALADAKSFSAYRRERLLKSRVPEMLAIALYEVFADPSDETVQIRRAVYEMWRRNPAERMRTMGFLAGQNTNNLAFGWSFLSAVGNCAKSLAHDAVRTGRWEHARSVGNELGDRIRWMVKGTLHLASPEPTKDVARSIQEYYGSALRVSMPKAEVVDHPSLFEAFARKQRREPADALRCGVEALLAHQADDGSWEGEVVSSPLLAAEYAIVCHLLELPIEEGRKKRILKQLEKARPAGAEPDPTVIALCYVASRLLGLAESDPALQFARDFIRREGGVASIASAARPWLAMLNLYDWSGVDREWRPAPNLESITASNFQVHCTPVIRALRKELYPEGFEKAVFEPASRTARAVKLLDKLPRAKARRKRAVGALRDRIREELKTTSHAGTSPASALLDIVALWLDDPHDADAQLALERFESWIWEDDVDGLRVAPARTAVWDTSFAVRALLEARSMSGVDKSLARADRFLMQNQLEGGGFCQSGAWHGFPAPDATAIALLARLENPMSRAGRDDLTKAVRFLLSASPRDVESTASSAAGLAAFADRHPTTASSEIARAIARSKERIRVLQNPDGSWDGPRGVIHATMFGVRGLLAAGTPPQDPGIRRASGFLLGRQRSDGGWTEGRDSQVVPTAQALATLLAAKDATWDAIERAASYLAEKQLENGEWPRQDASSLDEFVLYRSYFPIAALAQYERRRAERSDLVDPSARTAAG